ncbi:MAG TPA: hypothetical protein PLS77_14160 [Anaerolineaceae bacterium]|jgi:hypothetical protein|nr:hypothetical protein [Caldisericales bacterium]HNZ02390.1 hypothetical protein [Anaerolineaceae bacterium]HOH21546.1 hypothetical protein [Anaerolineaceae bacterium]HQF46964.1 hypothetical protein [Anaerolineaceae bacterium]HQH36840.1 hypothetical protein [Anaerolineaceae bacterium]
MQTVKLSNGREITVDIGRISVREYRALFNPEQKQDDEDSTLAKVAGLAVDELLDLSQPDYRRIITAMLADAKQPLDADPS